MSVELAEFKTLALRRAGGVLHVTLNRPERRNAMSMSMVHGVHGHHDLDAALGSEGIEGTAAFLQKRKASWVPDMPAAPGEPT